MMFWLQTSEVREVYDSTRNDVPLKTIFSVNEQNTADKNQAVQWFPIFSVLIFEVSLCWKFFLT